MDDTTPEARQVQLAAIRAMPPEKRLRRVFEMSEWHRRLIVAGLRTRFPDEPDIRLIERALGQRLVPDDFALEP
ncbi:MAG TPA: hypothetical protein PLL69_02035 [Gemmatimonadales bacterium]|nr:hypothetical protein [Gemmatimonadales bacterium]